MKSTIKKILLREFGETIEEYDEWLKMIYKWTTNPIYNYDGIEIIAYNPEGQYLGYWDEDQNLGFVVTEIID
jgi:hypothetical protein